MINSNKVYMVWYDNGEPWEDGYSCCEKIFSTLEAAEKFLDETENVVKVEDVVGGKHTGKFMWVHPDREEFTCSKGFTDCNDCKLYNDWFSSDINPEEYNDECDDEEYDYDEDVPCEEYYFVHGKLDEMYPYESWSIQEWTVED